MADGEFTSQWAILPAMVRYDKSLPANAKLIYAEIAAKINEEGYCFAHNQYFSERFGIKPDTVSSLIRRLSEAGYIRIDVDGARVNADRRRIYLTGKPYDYTGGTGFKSGTGKKSEGVPDLNPISIENSNLKYNPPKSPRGGRRARNRAEYEPELFERLWKKYPCGKDKAGAIREWDKLKADRELMKTMSAALERAMASEEWRRGIGIPYLCRWLSKRRWEDEEREAPCGAAVRPDTPEEQGAALWT